jgi:hypothetical protein
MNHDESCAGVILAIIALPLIVVVSSIANGFVLTVLWSWFVIPIFSLPPLNIPQAIGISLVMSYLTHQKTESKNDDKGILEQAISLLLYVILYPALVLGIAWIVQLFL